MEIKKLVSKATKEPLVTKDGKEMVELRFSVGDEFIPMYNGIKENEHPATVSGVEVKIKTYTLRCRVKNKDGVVQEYDGSDELYITLTPAQARSLQAKIDNGMEINQHLFVAYSYESKMGTSCVGVGVKGSSKPAKTFADFEKVNKSS